MTGRISHATIFFSFTYCPGNESKTSCPGNRGSSGFCSRSDTPENRDCCGAFNRGDVSAKRDCCGNFCRNSAKEQLAELGFCRQRARYSDRGDLDHLAQFRNFLALIFLFGTILLGGCTAASPWKLESISTGEQAFDSARLIYSEKESPLRFEIVRLDDAIQTFINLTKYKFATTDKVKIVISIDGEKIEGSVPVLEGRMRLRFPQDITEKLLYALQVGKKVAIIVDGFEERLNPESFETQYKKLGAFAS
jgi:hypothetical protein